jgi:hypothetical protein
VEYTAFVSLLCPWRLDGQRAGQPGLASRQGQDVSLLHTVQTGSGAHPTSYPMSTGGFSPGVLSSRREAEIELPKLISRVRSFLIESRATPGISDSF